MKTHSLSLFHSLSLSRSLGSSHSGRENTELRKRFEESRCDFFCSSASEREREFKVSDKRGIPLSQSARLQ
jgi:hypothetical protein